ncbi:MAG TPA: NAD(P)/FAD-dependent oxidoreductase [Acidimicrobiia bacterium]|nr:NAD(P)/FAD-dependent oxidoreductase [Acidimicrobiia bacterium]
MTSPDAVVIGSGPNGLVGANLLADQGWQVLVLEAQPDPGGAVRSGEVTEPGYVHDRFSAFYPLAAASPVIRSLGLEEFGLRWRHAPIALANPTPDGGCVVLSTDLDETAASLDNDAPGDGAAWRDLYARWQRVGRHLVDALLTPFPPVLAGARLAAALGPAEWGRFARLLLLPVRTMADEAFSGTGGGLLLGGNTLHTDLGPEQTLGGLFGWLLASLGQEHGFPVPQGGAGRLTDALVRRLDARGGRVVCSTAVTSIEVRGRRAVAVRTEHGDEVDAPRAVLADVGAPALYGSLVREEHLPARVVDGMRRFRYDHATVKIDWALDGPVPWTAEPARRAGTVHLGDSLDHLSEFATQLATGHIPARPFVLIGQMTTSDPTRSPPGTESLWGYTHVPHHPVADAGGDLSGKWDERETEAFLTRVERELESRAPGFIDRVVGRSVLTPPMLEAADANLVGGAVNGGTAQLHQQLIFRPTVGLGRAETPIRGLFLASASAHPGGGVHGACGANAARAALAADARRRVVAALSR